MKSKWMFRLREIKARLVGSRLFNEGKNNLAIGLVLGMTCGAVWQILGENTTRTSTAFLMAITAAVTTFGLGLKNRKGEYKWRKS